jgi:glucuronosyltransferase
MIEIAGVHVQKQKPLPTEWQKFLDEAKEGVVYFSMGSVVQSKDWTLESREALLKAFSKLKQKVLWKYENETLPNQPKNVKIGKWFPQRDILAHPNVKVFITHGGLLGTTEALVAGVPVIGIPVFGDQRLNIARAVDAGYGESLYFRDITEEKVSEALNKILNNPKYYETAQRISKQFNDRPLTPQQSVAYWSEYVINHQGAHHLRSPGNELSFIAYHLIDVYATLAFIFLLIVILIKRIIQKLLNLFKSSPKAKIN